MPCFICHKNHFEEKLIEIDLGSFYVIKWQYHNSCLRNVIDNPKNYNLDIVERCVNICKFPKRVEMLKECAKISKQLKG